MNKDEARRIAQLEIELVALGFTMEQVDTLRRASNTLRRWYENECNGAIQRDEESDIPYYYNTNSGKRMYQAPDREKGAIKRIEAIIGTVPVHKVAGYYIQGDPRGASLYILQDGDIPEGKDVATCYSRGICIY